MAFVWVSEGDIKKRMEEKRAKEYVKNNKSAKIVSDKEVAQTQASDTTE